MPHCHILIDRLRQRGYRITPQREMIIEALTGGDQHMTADDILGRVQRRTSAMNMATIYRTLDFLVQEGFISRVDLGGERIIYTTHHHGPHIHLVCRQCGTVIEADHHALDTIAQQIQEQYGFCADLHHLALPGLCARCQSTVNGER
jgi:Fur family ferric uptake transcriptional regulator